MQYSGSRTLKSLTLETFFARQTLNHAIIPALVMEMRGAELLVQRGAGNQLLKFRFVKAEAAGFGPHRMRLLHFLTFRNISAKFGFEEISRVELPKA